MYAVTLQQRETCYSDSVEDDIALKCMDDQCSMCVPISLIITMMHLSDDNNITNSNNSNNNNSNNNK